MHTHVLGQNGTFWQQVCRTEVWRWRGLKAITPQCTSWSPLHLQIHTEQSLQPTASSSSGIPVTAHKLPSLTFKQHTQSCSLWHFQLKECKEHSSRTVFLLTDQQIIMLVPNPWLPSSRKPLNSDAISLICLCHNHTPWDHQYPGSTQLWHCPSGSEGFLWMNVYKKVNLLIPIKCYI